jgi:AsmA protein
MKSLIRWVAIALAVLIALSILLSVALLILVDPNDYRDEISTAVNEQTGRTLTIDGELSLKTFPCCGVRLGQVSLSNPAGFVDNNFASVESAAVSVRLWPLIVSQQLVVDEVELTGLDLQLISQADGTVNWDFGSGDEVEETPDPEQGEGPGLEALNVAGIEVSDGRISYRDEATDELIEVQDINISTGAIAVNQAFNLTAGLSAAGLAPGITGTISLDSDVVIKDDLTIDLSTTRVELQLEGEDLPGGSASIRADVAAVAGLGGERIQLDALNAQLNAAGVAVTLSGDGALDDGVPALGGKLEIARFSLRDLLAQIGETSPETADGTVLQKFDLTADWRLDGDSAALEEIAITLDDTTAHGWLRIPSLEKQSIRLDLQFDAINLDRYLAPVDENAAASPAEAGDDALDLPVEDLRALDVEGRLGFGELIVSSAKLTSVNINLVAKDGLIRLNPLTASLYGGGYSGNIRLDVRGNKPKMSVNEKLKGVQLEPLLKDVSGEANLAGIGNVRIKAKSSGNSVSKLVARLKGEAALDIAEGKYLGVDLWYEIRKARARIKNEDPPPTPADPYTEISNFSGTAQITDGVLTNNDLRAEIPFLRMGGKGTVNLVKETLDYRLEARVVGRPTFEDGQTFDDLNGLVLPVDIKGPLESPGVSVDLAAVATSIGKRKLLDRLEKKLGIPDEDSDSEKGDGKSDSTKDQLKRGLRDLLGG